MGLGVDGGWEGGWVGGGKSNLPALNLHPKYWDRQALANSVDPDQTPQTRRLIRFYTVCHSFSTST